MAEQEKAPTQLEMKGLLDQVDYLSEEDIEAVKDWPTEQAGVLQEKLVETRQKGVRQSTDEVIRKVTEDEEKENREDRLGRS